MDNNPEPAAEPSALDKVAAALAELGQETAAAIAARAGVGYSTATKRLRLLEEAGQAEPFRSEDGRTFWRHTAGTATSTDGADTPAIAADDDGGDPPHPTLDDDAGEDPARRDESEQPAEDAGTEVAARPDDKPAGIPPDIAPQAVPDEDADPPNPQGSLPQQDDTTTEPDTTEAESEDTGDATPDNVENTVDVRPSGEAERAHGPDLAGTHHSAATSGQADAAHTSTGGKARRAKGSLRGAILDVLEAHPDQPFKTSQLCRAIDKANEGTGSARASAGAVVNALHKLVTDGLAIQVAERPTAFQLAPKAE